MNSKPKATIRIVAFGLDGFFFIILSCESYIEKGENTMPFHRNSQKRYYRKNSVYFITTNTCNRVPYFSDDIVCRLFVETMEYCRTIRSIYSPYRFLLYGYKINPDHVHILLKQAEGFTFSDIMGTIKRNFARDCNDMISGNDFIRSPQLRQSPEKRRSPHKRRFESSLVGGCGPFMEHIENIQNLRSEFFIKYGNNHGFVKFKWQKSFHYHIIEDDIDMNNHINYLKKQYVKHGLRENKFLFISDILV